MDEKDTYMSPLQNHDNELFIEHKDFAVVYNGSVGRTYEVIQNSRNREYGTTSRATASTVSATLLGRWPRTWLLKGLQL